tara:strand:- start:187 stop:441 length:255 start_codon:yes stop_codon:yes gene_type:complete
MYNQGRAKHVSGNNRIQEEAEKSKQTGKQNIPYPSYFALVHIRISYHPTKHDTFSESWSLGDMARQRKLLHTSEQRRVEESLLS